MSVSARRRFDGMLAKAAHPTTPLEEARVAAAAARAVATKHPDMPRGIERVKAAEQLIAIRTAGDALGSVGDALTALGKVAEDVPTIVRTATGSYSRRFTR